MDKRRKKEMKTTKTPWWRNRRKLVIFAFLAIVGYFLWTEHRAHVAPYLTWILLIAALLLNGFLHGGHGHGTDDTKSKIKW